MAVLWGNSNTWSTLYTWTGQPPPGSWCNPNPWSNPYTWTGQQPSNLVSEQATPEQGVGSALDEGGTGYVWKDRAWVKVRKVVRIGVSTQYVARPSSKTYVSSAARTMRAKSSGGTVVVGASRRPCTKSVLVALPKRNPCANSHSKFVATSLRVSRYNGTQLTLGMDEILALIEMM